MTASCVRRLDNAVRHRRDTEATHLSRTARFGDLALPHRLGPEPPALQLSAQVVQERGDRGLPLDAGDSPPVRAGGPGATIGHDPFPRHQQRGRVVHQVEQVVEPAAGIGYRPTVRFGLNLRYPPQKRSVAIQRRSTTVAPPRPEPFGRRCAQPRCPTLAVQDRGKPGTVPVFTRRSLGEVGTRLDPCDLAMATP